MDYQEVINILRDHSLKFHQAMIDGKIYTTQISQEEFLSKVSDELSDTAKRVVENHENIETSKLVLPLSLYFELNDSIAHSQWDYEFCYDGFFNKLTKLFHKTKFNLEWQYDEKALQLKYSLNNHFWAIENLHLKDEVDFEVYDNILNQLNNYLKEHGFVLYESVTGDQTGLMIFMPIDSPEIIKDFLIDVHDSRASVFYE